LERAVVTLETERIKGSILDIYDDDDDNILGTIAMNSTVL